MIGTAPAASTEDKDSISHVSNGVEGDMGVGMGLEGSQSSLKKPEECKYCYFFPGF